MNTTADINHLPMGTTPNSGRILIVDDEEAICDVLKINLELDGYQVDCATSAERALQLDLGGYDLLLLDVMMERMDGLQLAKIVRADETLSHVAIIFCTAKDTEADLLQGFAAGGDDYIKKPFSMAELVARVRSVLHRSRQTTVQRLVCGNLKLDVARASCEVDGKPVTLTRKEFDLLTYLMAHRGRVFSREELLTAVWEQDVYVIDRTIDVNINRLRKKLGDYGTYIVTKQGFGYGFKDRD